MQAASPLTPSPIDTSSLTIQQTTNPKPLVPNEKLSFGTSFTDHMLIVEWTLASGWATPKVVPYQPLALDPSANGLQYACQCFEGMKAYRDTEGGIRLFRPERNARRLNKSASRMSLPIIDENEFVELVARFVEVEGRFVPSPTPFSLYLRPTILATNASLAVTAPTSAVFFIVASPTGPYNAGFKPITTEARSLPRAWPGGHGDRKIGANYGPTLRALKESAQRGHDTCLWLSGPDSKVTEAGAMNLFFALRYPSGEKELVTPPADDGLILEGVTRDCVLGLAEEHLVPQGWKISQREITLEEVSRAAERGELLEAFGTGTAVIICPVGSIVWEDRIVICSQGVGELSRDMKRWIEERQYGIVDHPWSLRIGPAPEARVGAFEHNVAEARL